jgi:hypothetical protein
MRPFGKHHADVFHQLLQIEDQCLQLQFAGFDF